jgi:SAM-dependent methyltransferase
VEDESVDLACAVLVLHDVHNLAAALTQAHRVLRPGGILVAIQPQPWTDHPAATWTHQPDGVRRTIGNYTDEGFWSTGNATTGQNITTVRDIGWNHHTLATWLTTLAATGFCLTHVREPLGAQKTRPIDTNPWTDVPRFFAFRASKIG